MDLSHPDLHPLYAEHLDTLKSRTDAALERANREHLVIASGAPRYEFLDDKPYSFAPNPWFKYWVPVTKAPGSWLVYTPGQKPKLIYLQPHDYWHVVPEAPAGYWVEHGQILVTDNGQGSKVIHVIHATLENLCQTLGS